MSEGLNVVKLKAAATYNAAADCFDSGPLSFWSRMGRDTVERLGLPVGGRVLDVFCGSGASAIPAAEAVGWEGAVIAVDLAEQLLSLGRAKATAADLRQIDFRIGDMTALPFEPQTFDAVICVFGIFFVPDMERQVAELWRFVAPGRQLAVTTWGPSLFAPAYELWLSALRCRRPDLCAAFNPWDRINSPSAVRQLFGDAGIHDVEVAAVESHQPLRDAQDFWTIALGSGLRWTIEQLGAEMAAVVRQEVTTALRSRSADRVATNAIFAIARKPRG